MWGSECLTSIFFKLMFASLRSWSSFVAVVLVAIAAKGGLFLLQTTRVYFEEIVPRARRLACLSPSKHSFEEHLRLHSVSTFCTVFADILSGITILAVYPIATSCNNKAFYVSNVPSVDSDDGKRLAVMYSIQLVLDMMLGFWKRLYLTRQDVDDCKELIVRVSSSCNWSCLMIMLVAHYIQDVLLGLVEPKFK